MELLLLGGILIPIFVVIYFILLLLALWGIQSAIRKVQYEIQDLPDAIIDAIEESQKNPTPPAPQAPTQRPDTPITS